MNFTIAGLDNDFRDIEGFCGCFEDFQFSGLSPWASAEITAQAVVSFSPDYAILSFDCKISESLEGYGMLDVAVAIRRKNWNIPVLIIGEEIDSSLASKIHKERGLIFPVYPQFRKLSTDRTGQIFWASEMRKAMLEYRETRQSGKLPQCESKTGEGH